MNRDATPYRSAASSRRRRTWILTLLALLLVCGGVSWRLHQLRERARLSRLLISAVRESRITQAESLLKRGADPNARDTPEVPMGLLDFLKEMFSTKNRADRETYPTALLLAVSLKNEETYYGDDASKDRQMTALLLARGADINARYADGLTALMQACQYRNYDRIATPATLLIERGANVRMTDRKGNTALFYALEADRSELYAPLVSQGADPNTRNSDGSTALLSATYYGKLPLVQTLLAYGADPNLSNKPTGSYWREWENPLFNAFSFVLQESYYDEPVPAPEKVGAEIIRLLLAQGADPNTTDEDETPLLLHAIEEGKAEIVKHLLAAGADPRRGGAENQNALMTAAIQRSPEIVRLLLAWNRKAKTPFDINARDAAGQTALMIAAYNNDTDIVRLLLEHGASRTLRDREGRTALRYAEDSPAAFALLKH